MKERHPENRVRHDDGSIAPESVTHRHAERFEWAHRTTGSPRVHEVNQEQKAESKRSRHPGFLKHQKALAVKNRPAGLIENFEQAGHAAGRVEESGAKPGERKKPIEIRRPLAERLHLRVVDAEKPIYLKRSVPDAPEKHHDGEAVKIVHGRKDANDEQQNR